MMNSGGFPIAFWLKNIFFREAFFLRIVLSEMCSEFDSSKKVVEIFILCCFVTICVCGTEI